MPINKRRIVTTNPVATPLVRPNSHGAAQSYLRQRRKAPRPLELLTAMRQLDATIDPQAQQELIDWIRRFYDDNQGGELIGFFGRCFLGHSFVDHRLGLNGNIVEHFTPKDVPPPEFTSCRHLARSDAYAFIEVYSDGQIVPIRLDGTTAI